MEMMRAGFDGQEFLNRKPCTDGRKPGTALLAMGTAYAGPPQTNAGPVGRARRRSGETGSA